MNNKVKGQKEIQKLKEKAKELNKKIMRVTGQEQEDLHDKITSLKFQIVELKGWVANHKKNEKKELVREFSRDIKNKTKMLKKREEQERKLVDKFSRLFNERDRLHAKINYTEKHYGMRQEAK